MPWSSFTAFCYVRKRIREAGIAFELRKAARFVPAKFGGHPTGCPAGHFVVSGMIEMPGGPAEQEVVEMSGPLVPATMADDFGCDFRRQNAAVGHVGGRQ